MLEKTRKELYQDISSIYDGVLVHGSVSGPSLIYWHSCSLYTNYEATAEQ